MNRRRIRSQRNVIDDGFLDLIGREFATHEQGLAEWLKNAADATLASGLAARSRRVFLCFADGQVRRPPIFECVDFVGMTLEEIERRFKPWGRLSEPGEGCRRYGGYGIGGKFYMRQMFASSYLITYLQDRLSVFGFDQNRRYGYAHGYRNRLMSPSGAIGFAGIGPLVEIAELKDAFASGRGGFSVLRGVGPREIEGKIDVDSLCHRLRNHPQAHRPLKSLRISVIHNGTTMIERLGPRSIPRKPDFETPWVRTVPATLPREGGKEGEVVRLSWDSPSPGTLRLFVSSESLIQQGKMASLNRVDFLGREGVVASYRIDELGVTVPLGESIFGECRLSTFDHLDAQKGRKTRDKLVDSLEMRALLRWVASQVGLFSRMIEKKVSKRQRDL